MLGNSAHDDKIDELVQQSHLQQSFYSHAKNMREDKLEESMHQNVEGARAVTLAPQNPRSPHITSLSDVADFCFPIGLLMLQMLFGYHLLGSAIPSRLSHCCAGTCSLAPGSRTTH